MALEVVIEVNNGVQYTGSTRLIIREGLEIEKLEGNVGNLVETGDILREGWLDDDTVTPERAESSRASYGEYKGNGLPIKKISSWDNYQSKFDRQ